MNERERLFEALHSLESWTAQLVQRIDCTAAAAADIGHRIDHLAALMDLNARKAIEEHERIGKRDDALVHYLRVREAN